MINPPSDTRALHLREYAICEGVALSAHERDALREAIPGLSLSPSPGREGHYDVTPSSWVGALSLDNLFVDIHPKLPINRVLFLLSYIMDPRHWKADWFSYKEEESLVEAIAFSFVAQSRRALRHGVLHGYRHEEATLMTVRGRLRFADQVRDQFGRFPPVEVAYDEFSDDIQENRILKAALTRLARMRLRSDALWQDLRALDMTLSSVARIEYPRHSVPDITWTRLNEHYRPALVLARLILRAQSFDLSIGRVRASSFLVNMNQVFEDFVVAALRDALNLSERAFPQGAKLRALRLDESNRIVLEPDLSWWEAGQPLFVGDVKYKRVNAEGIKHPDLYQLLAYSIAADLPSGLLIYAAGEADNTSHYVRNAGKYLNITTLNLNGNPSEILNEIKLIAAQIQQSRLEGLHADKFDRAVLQNPLLGS